MKCKKCKGKGVLLNRGSYLGDCTFCNGTGEIKACNSIELRFNPKTGKNDYFFSKNGYGDAPGHGHAVIDADGDVHYLRNSTSPDATEEERESAVDFDDNTYL